MTNFTPGPWEVCNSVQVFTKLAATNASGMKADSTDGWMIADCAPVGAFVDGSIQEMPWQEQKANAALIADAPALLDALEDVRHLRLCS